MPRGAAGTGAAGTAAVGAAAGTAAVGDGAALVSVLPQVRSSELR